MWSICCNFSKLDIIVATISRPQVGVLLVNQSTGDAHKQYHAVRAMINHHWGMEQFYHVVYFKHGERHGGIPGLLSWPGVRRLRTWQLLGQGIVGVGHVIHGALCLTCFLWVCLRVTPDDEARFCEAALRAYLEQLVTRHIFSCVDSFFSALSLLSSCELMRGPRLSSSCHKQN